jgi:hypothetical protein
MRTIRVLLACAVIACGALVAPLQAARADSLLPTFIGITNLGGGLYQYDYSVQLAGNQSQVLGDGTSFFTMYDFNGFVSAAVTGTNGTGSWTPTTQGTGFTAVNTAPVDNPGKTNVTFHYDIGSPTQTGPINPIFSFKIVSTIGVVSTTANTFYTGQDWDVNVGELQGNVGKVKGAAAVPELGTAPLLAGMLGLGGLALRKRRAA